MFTGRHESCTSLGACWSLVVFEDRRQAPWHRGVPPGAYRRQSAQLGRSRGWTRSDGRFLWFKSRVATTSFCFRPYSTHDVDVADNDADDTNHVSERHPPTSATMVAAGSITVAVRLRPPTAWEAARLPEPVADASFRCDAALSAPVTKSITSQTNLRHIVQIIDDRVLTFDPEERDPSRAFVERGFLPPGTKRYKDRRFIFDRVFRHDTRQEDVYDGTVKPLLENLLNGYNATVFAYGVSTAILCLLLQYRVFL